MTAGSVKALCRISRALWSKIRNLYLRVSLLECENLKAFLGRSENKPLLRTTLERVGQMADTYHQAALTALHEIKNVELKRLLSG